MEEFYLKEGPGTKKRQSGWKYQKEPVHGNILKQFSLFQSLLKQL